MSKQRIIALQKQVKIARDALVRIVNGHAGNIHHVHIAEEALDDMRRHDPSPPVAGLMGWERRP